jgi:hypothetical protein
VKGQGVAFNDKQGFSLFRDPLALAKMSKQNPTDNPWVQWLRNVFGEGLLPPVAGVILMGQVAFMVNSVDFLNDIYIN